jgi:hypothetical protein
MEIYNTLLSILTETGSCLQFENFLALEYSMKSLELVSEYPKFGRNWEWKEYERTNWGGISFFTQTGPITGGSKFCSLGTHNSFLDFFIFFS